MLNIIIPVMYLHATTEAFKGGEGVMELQTEDDVTISFG